ncbi:hypothetical protein Asal01_00259 [Fodinibius salicampi]
MVEMETQQNIFVSLWVFSKGSLNSRKSCKTTAVLKKWADNVIYYKHH